MTHAYIYDAVRTPRGKARAEGGLAPLKPQELVGGLVDGLQATRPRRRATSQALVLGCVDQVGDQGANIALVSKLHAGVADDAYAFTLNNYCVSGLTAIGHAATQVAAGSLRPGARRRRRDDVARAVPGRPGQLLHGRELSRSARASFPSCSRPTGWRKPRASLARELDAVSLDLATASRRGRSEPGLDGFAHPARWPEQSTNARGRNPPPNRLAAMPPSFRGAGRAIRRCARRTDRSPPHDRSCAADLRRCRARVDRRRADRRRDGRAHGSCGYAESGGDPHASLLAGFSAMDKVLQRTGLTLADMDRIEFMEAFAVTIAKFLRDYPVDPAKVNVARRSHRARPPDGRVRRHPGLDAARRARRVERHVSASWSARARPVSAPRWSSSDSTDGPASGRLGFPQDGGLRGIEVFLDRAGSARPSA